MLGSNMPPALSRPVLVVHNTAALQQDASGQTRIKITESRLTLAPNQWHLPQRKQLGLVKAMFISPRGFDSSRGGRCLIAQPPPLRLQLVCVPAGT